MFVDARELPDSHELEADVCVVGGGPAGLSFASRFVNSGAQVILLESGGVLPDPETQDLYRGHSVGQSYAPLNGSRLRYLGGTSNHWTGYIRQLRTEDFEGKPWLPGSGWPIAETDLADYYEEAKKLLELGGVSLNGEHWAAQLDLPFLDFDRSSVRHGVAVLHPLRFGEFARQHLTKPTNVQIVLHANLYRIRVAENARSVESLDVRTLSRKRFSVRARYYVLACGGIENARLMLASDDVEKGGICNEHDVVGRYFMEHPYFSDLGELFSPAQTAQQLRGVYGAVHSTDEDLQVYPQIEVAEPLKAKNEILGTLVKIRRKRRPQRGITAIRSVRDFLAGNQSDMDFGAISDALLNIDDFAIHSAHRIAGARPINRLTVTSEQRAHPESRVSLDFDDRDALGMPRVKLNWYLSDDDFDSIQQGVREVAIELSRLGVARVRLPAFEQGEEWREQVTWAYHQMGTTRMGRSMKESVVDSDCRVHNKSNLFVAGSSVFPGGGTATPTFTIISLAIRLADDIQSRLSRGD